MQQKLSGTYSEMPFARQDKNNVIGLFSATYRLPLTPWVKNHRTEVRRHFVRDENHFKIWNRPFSSNSRYNTSSDLLQISLSKFSRYSSSLRVCRLPPSFWVWLSHELSWNLAVHCIRSWVLSSRQPRPCSQLFTACPFIRKNILLKGSLKWQKLDKQLPLNKKSTERSHAQLSTLQETIGYGLA